MIAVGLSNYLSTSSCEKGIEKHLRGVRPIERAVEQRNDAEADGHP